MKRFSKISTLVLAGAISVVMGSTASFAQNQDYKQLMQSVKAQLVTLQVPTNELGRLTVSELAQLTAILAGSENDTVKARSANFVLDQSLHPSAVTTDSTAGKLLIKQASAALKNLGIPYPKQPLTAIQAQALLNATIAHDSKPELQKRAVEGVIAMMNRPPYVAATNAGVGQLEMQIDAKLANLGLTPPPAGTMSVDQLGKLQGIFDQKGSEAEMKASVLVVLGTR